MKKAIFGLAVIAVFLTACGNDDEGAGDASRTIRLQKLDLSDAKYLSLTGTPTRAAGDTETEVGLFKIDENGTVSTVVLSCTEAEDGTVTQVRTDIEVAPRHLASLSGIYTLMADCEFRTAEGTHVDMLAHYEPGAYGAFNMLVRNSDGKIYYIPQAAGRYFENTSQFFRATAPDHRGNVYVSPYNGRELLLITPRGDDLVIEQVNPNNIGVAGDEIWPMENGTVVLADKDSYSCTFFYPDGGFESLNDNTLFLSDVDSGIKAVRLLEVAGVPRNEFVISLHDYHVGASAGNNRLSAPIASLSSGTDYSTNLGDANYLDWVSKASVNREWISSVYETADSYLLGTCLVVDKRTNRIAPLDREQSNRVIIPTQENTYKGLTWSVSDSEASWFDVRTLEGGIVHFDLSQAGSFQKTDFFANIPAGEATVTGVRNSDGRQVICIVNIETGRAVCSVNDSKRPITVLVPLN